MVTAPVAEGWNGVESVPCGCAYRQRLGIGRCRTIYLPDPDFLLNLLQLPSIFIPLPTGRLQIKHQILHVQSKLRQGILH